MAATSTTTTVYNKDNEYVTVTYSYVPPPGTAYGAYVTVIGEKKGDIPELGSYVADAIDWVKANLGTITNLHSSDQVVQALPTGDRTQAFHTITRIISLSFTVS